VLGAATYGALSRSWRGRWRPWVFEGLVAETEEIGFGNLSGLAVEIGFCGGHLSVSVVVDLCMLGMKRSRN
jgi:hypothetical protein